MKLEDVIDFVIAKNMKAISKRVEISFMYYKQN